MNDTNGNKASNEDFLKQEKIESLQKMIDTAEQTITSARQMLAQLQGVSRQPNYPSTGSREEGRVVYGNFDGQVMIGDDGKQYPVPANYASKSKIVEGDLLKLNITQDGSFIYKQVGPVERKYLIGIVESDERGNHLVNAEGKKYKVLLAAATYFKIEFGDEVTLVVPRDHASVWGAIENILRKAEDINDIEEGYSNVTEEIEEGGSFGEVAEKEKSLIKEKGVKEEVEEESADEIKEEELGDENKKNMSAIERLQKEIEEERKRKDTPKGDIIDEWIPDIDQIKEEASVGADSSKSEA